ncbi:MAG: hypothetical protein HQM11_17785 [SAR324 cluster bacterium]|nr:hypothetical protein [SAR324 cluster bacterium]
MKLKKHMAVGMMAGIIFSSGNVLAQSGHNMDHGSMSSGEHDMMMAQLGPGKKSQFLSKNKSFMANAEKVPLTSGWAQFQVKLTNSADKPLSSKAMIEGKYEMPGMTMDDSHVEVKRISEEMWELGLPLSMAGMWKIYLDIMDQGSQDQLEIKFVTK